MLVKILLGWYFYSRIRWGLAAFEEMSETETKYVMIEKEAFGSDGVCEKF